MAHEPLTRTHDGPMARASMRSRSFPRSMGPRRAMRCFVSPSSDDISSSDGTPSGRCIWGYGSVPATCAGVKGFQNVPPVTSVISMSYEMTRLSRGCATPSFLVPTTNLRTSPPPNPGPPCDQLLPAPTAASQMRGLGSASNAPTLGDAQPVPSPVTPPKRGIPIERNPPFLSDRFPRAISNGKDAGRHVVGLL